MSAQQYLQSLLDQQNLSDPELNALRNLRGEVEAQVRTLQGVQRVLYGGSFGKDTMIREFYDLDIVVYWANDCGHTLEGIFRAVGEVLRKKWKFVNPKTVAWEMPFEGGFHVDVVPGRALDTTFKYANLYRTDTRTSLQTSIKVHIDTVTNSGRRDAIRLMKLWRKRKSVPFKKSLALELATIEGCKGSRTADFGDQVWAALHYLRDVFPSARIVDPANSNNIISDDISEADKNAIKQIAAITLQAKTWPEVF
jgi:Second Messenger Oligonucleotide or Dinucleotide Synthetase domain